MSLCEQMSLTATQSNALRLILITEPNVCSKESYAVTQIFRRFSH